MSCVHPEKFRRTKFVGTPVSNLFYCESCKMIIHETDKLSIIRATLKNVMDPEHAYTFSDLLEECQKNTNIKKKELNSMMYKQLQGVVERVGDDSPPHWKLISTYTNSDQKNITSETHQIANNKNPVSILNEYAMKNKFTKAKYSFNSYNNNSLFVCKCSFNEYTSEGFGYTKKEAKNFAARDYIKKYQISS